MKDKWYVLAKIFVFVLMFVLQTALSQPYQNGAARPPVTVKFSKNVELFGLILHIDNGPDLLSNHDSVTIENKRTTWQHWYQLLIMNYKRYRAFSDAPVIKLYRKYSKEGYFNDQFIKFLLQTEEVPFAVIRKDTDSSFIAAFSTRRDYREGERLAKEFLKSFNSFYASVKFEKYLAENKRMYDLSVSDVRKHVSSMGFIDLMETFYQKKFDSYIMVPSVNTLPTQGFGVSHLKLNRVYNVFGPFSFQSYKPDSLVSGFDYPERIDGLSIHEFGHSFVNPLIDLVPQSLIDSTEYLFREIEEVMKRQAYPSWKISLYEHFVRAGEVIIATKMGKDDEASAGLSSNIQKGYKYLPFIVDQLKEYDRMEIQSRSSIQEQIIVIIRRLLSKFPRTS